MTILRTFATMLILCALSGCGKDEVETYEVSKEAPKGWPTENHSGAQKGELVANPASAVAQPAVSTTPAPASAPSNNRMQALPGMAEQSAKFDTPKWVAPADWAPQPLGSMRKGSWKIASNGLSADVSVLAFPGNVGGDLANVNRWAGQVGAKTLTPEELAISKEENTISVDDHLGLLVELTGKAGKSIKGVILPYHGDTWFFKMQGDTELVNAQAVNFEKFMSSVRFPAHH